MSTKDLFERNYLAENTEKSAFSDIESADNLKALTTKKNTFVPQIQYSDPQTFARFGSARLYYKSAVDRILDFYPYDGSDAELNSFHNKSLDIEKYIFDKRYPRTNGYAIMASDGWGTLDGSKTARGYGKPQSTQLEYIEFKGGPNTISEIKSIKTLAPNPNNSEFQYSNVYDENIYTNAGLVSNYGSGSRVSNLDSDFARGTTVEFWAKTGSLSSTLTEKQVVLDLWNNELSSSAHYGRLTIELDSNAGASTPWRISVHSGANGISSQAIGQNVDLNSLSDWKHYSFVLQNSGSVFRVKLYVDGVYNHARDFNASATTASLGALNPRNMMGRLGSLMTVPSGAADASETSVIAYHAGAGKLSGSIDEFRFWKVARDGQQIGRHWFTQVRGGSNTDISNTTLGLYYKFNEGITTDSSLDSVVLDYGGRICNGAWTGYSSTSRNTGSAIISASAATKEYEDPIVYSTHADVASLKSELEVKGAAHDTQSTSMFLNLLPSWIVEESEESGTSDLEKLSHIVGAYFDKMYLQISALPSFRHATYTSSSYKPLPFAKHLPQSLGLNMPEIFIDSTVMEKFLNRDDKSLFESDLQDTKNLIYQNLYNNLAAIFKSKGTERSIRNVLRCFNINDDLIYINAYASNQTYQLKNNLKQTQKRSNFINFNQPTALDAVIYQDKDPYYTSATTRPYISGTNTIGYEDLHGLTVETSILFPRFVKSFDKVHRDFKTVSLFGMHSASSTATSDTTIFDSDGANFQVFAVRPASFSKDVYFKLTSSNSPFPFNFNLTSSLFKNTYNDESWNISVGVKPSLYPFSNGLVSGSGDVSSTGDNSVYDVVFRGFNNKLGSINNNFELTASISKTVAQTFLRANKRVYIGARNVNITGSNLNQCDVLFRSTKYWTKFVDNLTLKQHTLDRENYGISASYLNTDFLPHNSGTPLASFNTYSQNFNTLALNWYFGNVTGSDASGNFWTVDLSSGSISTNHPGIRQGRMGPASNISEYVHSGKGANFDSNDSKVVERRIVNEFKFVNPENIVSSDRVRLRTETEELFENNEVIDEIPNYLFTIEKSLYAALSEEILDFFAGVIDFNNLIGEPVNRYRMEYKALGHLRRIFFEKFNSVSDVEKYSEYFKWFDDAISNIIEQLIPASVDLSSGIFNVVESHVLERNKYQTMFPTLEFHPADPAASARGFWEKYASYIHFLYGGLERSPRPTDEHKGFWLKRAQPGPVGTGDFEITSSNTSVDKARVIIRNQMHQRPEFSGSAKIFKTSGGQRYMENALLASQLNGVVALQDISYKRAIKGGVNFEHNKDIHYTYTSLYPAGPVDSPGGAYIPQNVLFAETKDFEPIESVKLALENKSFSPTSKRKRYVKVVQGRDFDEGLGYTANKNAFAFPFNIMSGAISGGVDEMIRARAMEGITITNLHNDVYGEEMEVPLQGTFTERVVGGHQSRHIGLNVSRSTGRAFGGILYNGLDDYTSRPEAWKILLGTRTDCPAGVEGSGVIGMAGADYPFPEANDVGATPYPMTASQKAVYYRGHMAKRPVNIRNIQMTTGTVLPTIGNYTQQYEILHSFGAEYNPRNFVENNPSLPPVTFQNLATSSTQTRTFLDRHRTQDNHFQFMDEFDISYITGTLNRSIITTRFSPAGGMLTDSPAYSDFKANEYSVYAASAYRDLAVIKHSQGPAGTVSEATGTGTAGTRVSDIHRRDYGLTSHYARHTAKFGRDSMIYPEDNERKTYNLGQSFIGYGGGIYRNADSLQGWWRLNANISAAGDATDSSGCGRPGTFATVSGGADRPNFSASLGPSRYIQTGSCAFDGADAADDSTSIGTAAAWDGIIGNDTGAGSTEMMSLAAWVYKAGDGENNYGRIMDFGQGDIRWYTGTSERVYFATKWNGNNVVQWKTAANQFSLNAWAHIVITYDARAPLNNPKIYVNGVEKSVSLDSGTQSGTYYGIVSQEAFIGNNSDGTRTWEGNLADVAVWNDILDPEEIKAIYNATKEETSFGPGTVYEQLPGFHKTHRNNLCKVTQTEELVPVYSPAYALANLGGTQVSSSTSGIAGNNNPTFLLTGSHTDAGPATTAPTLLAGLSGSGLSWTGWLKFDAVYTHTSPVSEIGEMIWQLGLGTSSKIKAKLEKVKAGAGDHRFQMRFTVATLGGPAGDIKYNWQFPAGTYDLSSSWNHYALVWGTPGQAAPVDGTLDSTTNFLTSATLYFNGVSQSAFEIDAGTPRPNYDNRTGAKSSYRNFSSLEVTGSSYMNIAGGLTTAGDRLSASVDEFTFWTTPLYTASITEIYNSGIPCDITASTLYSNSSSAMWDWIRFEEAPDTYSSLNIDAANPGTYNSSTNNLVGFKNNQFLPLDASGQQTGMTFAAGAGPEQNIMLTGCVRVLEQYATQITYKTTEQDYDNFFVTRPIPRSTRQYSWITASLKETSGSLVCGYVRGDYTHRITSSAGTVSYIEPLDFITASQAGVYNNGTQNIFAVDLGAVEAYGGGVLSSTWLPVDFVGLNTIIYEPLTASTRTVGLPNNIPFTEPGTNFSTNPGAGSYYNDTYLQYIEPRSAASLALGASPPGLNALLLNRNGPYGWTSFKQLRQRNHPVLRNERKTNTLSYRSEGIPGIAESFGEAYPSIPYSLRTFMNIFDTGGKRRAYSTNAASHLVGWWKMNADVELSGNIADDSVNNNYMSFLNPKEDYPPVGTANIATNTAEQVLETPNAIMQSASADWTGVDTVGNIGTADNWNKIIGDESTNRTMTFAGWFIPRGMAQNSNGWPRLMDFGNADITIIPGLSGTVNPYPDPSYTGSVPLNFSVRWNGATCTWRTPTSITNDHWWHYAITYDAKSTSNEPTIYLNGISQSITQHGTAPSGLWNGIVGVSGTNDCFVGSGPAGYYAVTANKRQFYGYMADIAVWDTVLSAEDISALAHMGSSSVDFWKITTGDESQIKNESQLTKVFDLRPVSMKGRPAYINMDFANTLLHSKAGLIEKRQNATFKSSYNNEEIFFNQQELNKLVGVNKDLINTSFEQLVSTKHDYNSQANWILYTENVFPSHRMEFASESVARPFYENQFWKDSQNARVAASIGFELRSSLGAWRNIDIRDAGTEGSGSTVINSLSQSIWPLDAPADFETRTQPPRITTYATSSTDPYRAYLLTSLIVSNSAGELQNTYSSYNFLDACAPTSSAGYWEVIGAGLTVRNAALYSRKHMLNSPISISPPSSIQNINQLVLRNVGGGLYGFIPGSIASGSSGGSTFVPTNGPGDFIGGSRGGYLAFWQDYPVYRGAAIQISAAIGIEIEPLMCGRMPAATGSGEAKWEAPALAGYLTTSNGVTGFVSAPSEPWYNDYDAFREDIKAIAKGYAIVPEFRISEKVEDYYKFGPQGAENFDLFTIPGTTISSSSPQFYKDYSNSDFMENFLDIKQLSDLDAKEIRVTCHATIKFNPYKGFYPVQRTQDLVSQFSKSYGSSVTVTNGTTTTDNDDLISYSWSRPLTRPLFAPGILYNSIKSGIAVDYPIVTNGDRVHATHVTGSNEEENWLIGSRYPSGSFSVAGGQSTNPSVYTTGSFFDQRIPFEAIIEPAQSLLNVYIPDIEPHPSMSIGFPYETNRDPYASTSVSGTAYSASLSSPPSDNLYTLMASNFFAEVGMFFLKDSNYTKLESHGVATNNLKFGKGEVYGARLRIKTSYTGSRTYNYEFDGNGAFNANPYASSQYSSNGCRGVLRQRTSALGLKASGSFEIPQDPAHSADFKQDFIMYNRTTAFGPPMLGRPYAYSGLTQSAGSIVGWPLVINQFAISSSYFGHKDSLNGYNWAYTPPYHNGEAWVDFIFAPTASVAYDLQRILAETQTITRRFDPGPPLSASSTSTIDLNNSPFSRALVRDRPWVSGATEQAVPYDRTEAIEGALPTLGRELVPAVGQPYSGPNIDKNAMQLDACVNLFGVENIFKKQVNKFNQEILSENEVVGQKWVIQPKFETPMMNFSDTGIRPITSSTIASENTLTLPTNFGSESVPRGMWHQFGILPETPKKGIFLEIGDIPSQWLENHYEVFDYLSPYNDFNVENTYANPIHKKMKSFSKLMGFDSDNSSKRLGELKDKMVIKEAVIAIPYVVEGLSQTETQIETGADQKNPQVQQRKKFISIPKKRVAAAMRDTQNTVAGDSLDAAGASIRRLMHQMEGYILPPQFNFIENKNIEPIVMYIFEFKYELDKDDLSYIWQNLAPRNYKKLDIQKDSTAHQLINTELLTELNLLDSENLRWMVFKVKQKSQGSYKDMTTAQVGHVSRQRQFMSRQRAPYEYNWPYDFVSIVESIKLDVEVMYKDPSSRSKLKSTFNRAAAKKNILNKKFRRKKATKFKEKKYTAVQYVGNPQMVGPAKRSAESIKLNDTVKFIKPKVRFRSSKKARKRSLSKRRKK